MEKKLTFKDICPFVDYHIDALYRSEKYYPDYPEAIIVNFHGQYRDWSAGDDDAKFMRGITMMTLDIWSDIPIIVDICDLIYEWWDRISYAFPFSVYETPQAGERVIAAVIVWNKNRKALSSLYNTIDIVDNEKFFDNRNNVWKKLKIHFPNL